VSWLDSLSVAHSFLLSFASLHAQAASTRGFKLTPRARSANGRCRCHQINWLRSQTPLDQTFAAATRIDFSVSLSRARSPSLAYAFASQYTLVTY
jgi:hypothetical protein